MDDLTDIPPAPGNRDDPDHPQFKWNNDPEIKLWIRFQRAIYSHNPDPVEIQSSIDALKAYVRHKEEEEEAAERAAEQAGN